MITLELLRFYARTLLCKNDAPVYSVASHYYYYL
eukprot:UN00116